jgi:hypothetical protein
MVGYGVDCLITQGCVSDGYRLPLNDSDFWTISRNTPLRPVKLT